VRQAPPARPASEEPRLPVVSPESLEQQVPQASQAFRPVEFRPKQKGKQKVQPEYPQGFRPRLDEAAAFPQNRWS
jgi:hypothetical protein